MFIMNMIYFLRSQVYQKCVSKGSDSIVSKGSDSIDFFFLDNLTTSYRRPLFEVMPRVLVAVPVVF